MGRAYEGREAVLLELLETKALIKANADDSMDNLPEYLRRNPGLQQNSGDGPGVQNLNDPGDPDFALPDEDTTSASQSHQSGYDDVNPTSAFNPQTVEEPKGQIPEARDVDESYPQMEMDTPKKKKKGMFGGIFKRRVKRIKSP